MLITLLTLGAAFALGWCFGEVRDRFKQWEDADA